MKRTASTLLLLAGLGGGGCVSPTPQAQKQAPAGGFGTVTQGKQIASMQGPLGEPVMGVRGAPPGGVQQAGGTNTLFGTAGDIRPASGMSPTYITSSDGCTNCSVPGIGGSVIRDSGYGQSSGAGTYRPQMPQMPRYGIVPTPGMGPPGAVAAVGALMPGMGGPGMNHGPMINGRSSINFAGPAGMKVTWQLPDGSFLDERDGLTAPKEYNFLQGQVYRLRLSSILPDHPGKSFYPTLEVAPATPRTLTFLAHSSVPITFSPDDFAQARAGNLVVKVVYLPDPANQDFATVVGAEEVVSTRLEPGADPVAEAQRRGTILAVIRMGNIDLENRISPAMTAPPPGMIPHGPPHGVPLPGPRPVPPGPPPMPKNSWLSPTAPTDPLAPMNPPGTATVKPPATLPALTPTIPILAPTAPPVAPPFAPPVKAPVTPPVKAPVTPPVAAPVAPPVAAPVAAPVAPPVAAPVAPPAVVPAAPTDLPPAPIAPDGPIAPGPKAK
jgi:hypothetical protein